MGRTLEIIDLFAGCGGLTEGFRATGAFIPTAAVEIDLDAAATYAANFGDHIALDDISQWIERPLPRADVVVGGPPCQGFSALGLQNPADPRNAMWRHYVEVLTRVKPGFFVLENVPQFLKSREWSQFSKLTVRGGKLAKYRLESFVLNAADYGVGQSRKRAVIIGRRRELDEIGPPPPRKGATMGSVIRGVLPEQVDTIDLPRRVSRFRHFSVPGTFKLNDLHVTRRPTELSMQRYRAIPPGGNRHDLPDELLTPCWRKHKSGAGDVMGRLTWDKPAVTIRTEFFKPEKGRYLHPTEHRPITHAEAALLQGFDDSFVWCGTKTTIARQIGNAVPPLLAQAIAEHLIPRIE